MKKMSHDPGSGAPLAGWLLERRTGWRGSIQRQRSVQVSLVFLMIVLLVLVGIGLAGRLRAGSPSVQATTSTVAQIAPPRRGGSMVYDAARRVVLLFGGTLLTASGGQTNETWNWDGQNWHQLHPLNAPPALQGTMVYDPVDQQVLLLLYQVESGGSVNNQMWSWDGQNWHQLHPALLPEVLNVSLAYDGAQGQMVLFGGAVPNGSQTALVGITWLWNGSTWLRQNPPNSPASRTGAALTYDAAKKQLILYGGVTATGLSAETWAWNGQTWQQESSANGPASRQNALLVYDNASQQTLLFGGLNAGGTQSSPGDTWTWNGQSWQRIVVSGAPTDLYESAVYDQATQSVVVYAVQGFVDKLTQASVGIPVSQTWLWNGVAWKLLS